MMTRTAALPSVSEQKGLTLIEVMISISVLVVGVMGMMMALVNTIQLQQENREYDLAANAARATIDTMRAYPDFGKAFHAYNDDPTDDPDGPGTAPGSSLPLIYGVSSQGPYTAAASSFGLLDPQGGTQGGFTKTATLDTAYATSIHSTNTEAELIGNETLEAAVVRVDFPGNGAELREDVVNPLLGLPRDLDGDGKIDSVDHSGDYMMLPVTIRVTWNGVAGPMTYEVRTFLTNK